jgi:hypothetical protein
MAGRPTDYSKQIQDLADDYLLTYMEGDNPQTVPTAAGLALHLGISKATVYNWAKKFTKFLDTLDTLNAVQEVKLTNGSLSNQLNSNISKLMLANHGYSDKTIVDNTSSDGSMTPDRGLADFYADVSAKPES